MSIVKLEATDGEDPYACQVTESAGVADLEIMLTIKAPELPGSANCMGDGNRWGVILSKASEVTKTANGQTHLNYRTPAPESRANGDSRQGQKTEGLVSGNQDYR